MNNKARVREHYPNAYCEASADNFNQTVYEVWTGAEASIDGKKGSGGRGKKLASAKYPNTAWKEAWQKCSK